MGDIPGTESYDSDDTCNNEYIVNTDSTTDLRNLNSDADNHVLKMHNTENHGEEPDANLIRHNSSENCDAKVFRNVVFDTEVLQKRGKNTENWFNIVHTIATLILLVATLVLTFILTVRMTSDVSTSCSGRVDIKFYLILM